MVTLEDAVATVREAVDALDPDALLGPDAARLTEVAADGGRLLDAARLRLAKRAADTGGWTRTSQARSVEQWLASVSGSSEGAAREVLSTADRLDTLPSTAAKLRAGELSIAQAAQVAAGAAADPSAETRLLGVAEHQGFRALRADKERVIAAATDEAAAHAVAVRERHVRTWVRGLATHGSFSGPTEAVDVLLRALEPLEKDAFENARKTDTRESADAYRFDALIALARQGGNGTAEHGAKRTKPVCRVRVDLDALLRGHTEAGETCEIPGVGPVSVGHAREVLSHGLLELVITDGVEVQSVLSTTRHVPRALQIAIEERDRRCKIRDCDCDAHLERHHLQPFKPHGITRYRVLGNLCPAHHDMVTYQGHTIIEHDDGSWSLRALPHTDAA